MKIDMVLNGFHEISFCEKLDDNYRLSGCGLKKWVAMEERGDWGIVMLIIYIAFFQLFKIYFKIA